MSVILLETLKILISITNLRRGTIPIAYRIYRQTQIVGIPVCNEHNEQYQGEGEQLSLPLKYTNGHNPLVYPYIMNTINSVRVKGNNSHRFKNIPTTTTRLYTRV